ncbi:D-glycerate dehydrogenase [Thalassobacillus sp. CUG 92003]|uniref:2-hydroxyacid dehydrogenase n=1 Tax=Thalassobacillus sp. CUG 92003 TaxID=2736641 RepID=UPI0015E7A3DD|nr:D-glycerate dehydrogenase [Thalassobacillus sp. CUG 92003]
MNKPYIYITRKLPESVVQPFKSEYDIHMWPYSDQPVDRETLLHEAAKADALLTMLTDRVDEALLNAASELTIVANLAVGYDNVDVASAKARGIHITNTPDVLTDTTADLTFALLMATARKLTQAEQFIKDGEWDNWSPLLMAGTDVHHKTLGIVGMGRIGEAVAQRAQGFDMEVIYHNRSRKSETEEKLGVTYSSFESLLQQSDFVVCLAPLTSETTHLFNEAAFQQMKQEAIFINTSRGKIVDGEALYQALVSGEIKAAGLDVFEEEPINSDHPLLNLDQTVCLPHIGSASTETRIAMMELCLDNITRVLQGEDPITPVT